MSYRLGRAKMPYGDMWDDNWMQKWYNKNPISGRGYSPSSDTQRRAQQNKLAWDARSIMPAEGPQGHLTQEQEDVLYPFGKDGYTADQASLYRAGPNPGRLPKVLAPQMQENFNTIERANQLGYFTNPGQAFNPAYGLGGIGQRDFYQDSLAPGAWKPDATNWSSITGYGAADSFAGNALKQGGSGGGRSLSGSVNMGANGPEVTVEQGGCTTSKGCSITEAPHAPNKSHNEMIIGGEDGTTAGGNDLDNFTSPTDFPPSKINPLLSSQINYNPNDDPFDPNNSTNIENQYNSDQGFMDDMNQSQSDRERNQSERRTQINEGLSRENSFWNNYQGGPSGGGGGGFIPAKNPFGDDYPEKDVPITGDMQNLLGSLASGNMGLQNYMKTGMNHGIIPIPAQQRLAKTYFDPRRESIDAMSDELSSIANRRGGLAQSGAALELANRSRGQSGQLQQAVNESMGYNYKETTDRLSDIAMNKWSLKDGLTAQEQDIDVFNMKSKPGFADGLSNALAQGANIIGNRIWDTTMRNKYGWTPLETGWVNASLAELAQQHNMSLMELQYQLKTKLAQDTHDINEPSDTEKGLDYLSDLAPWKW